MVPPVFRMLDDAEVAEVFARKANGEVQYKGTLNGLSSGEIYYRLDRAEDGTALYFHYWLMIEGKMLKVGSGGYIPDLHQDPKEQLKEFSLKGVVFGERKTLKE